MSAWSIVNAMLGLGINAGTYEFRPKPEGRDVKLFFAFDSGTAHYIRKTSGASETISIEVKTGTFRADKLVLSMIKYAAKEVEVSIDGRRLLLPNSAFVFGEHEVEIGFTEPPAVGAGSTLTIRIS